MEMLLLLGVFAWLLWLRADMQDLKRQEARYRREKTMFDLQMKALLGVESLPPARPGYVSLVRDESKNEEK